MGAAVFVCNTEHRPNTIFVRGVGDQRLKSANQSWKKKEKVE